VTDARKVSQFTNPVKPRGCDLTPAAPHLTAAGLDLTRPERRLIAA